MYARMNCRSALAVAGLLVGASATLGDVPVYDYRAGGNLYNYPETAPSWPSEDQLLAPLSGGMTYGAFLTQVTVGVASRVTPHSTELVMVWYDTVDFDGQPAASRAFPISQAPFCSRDWTSRTPASS